MFIQISWITSLRNFFRKCMKRAQKLFTLLRKTVVEIVISKSKLKRFDRSGNAAGLFSNNFIRPT
jgi:hypothetical protein